MTTLIRSTPKLGVVVPVPPSIRVPDTFERQSEIFWPYQDYLSRKSIHELNQRLPPPDHFEHHPSVRAKPLPPRKRAPPTKKKPATPKKSPPKKKPGKKKPGLKKPIKKKRSDIKKIGGVLIDPTSIYHFSKTA